jgi:predicted transcriptional regulator
MEDTKELRLTIRISPAMRTQLEAIARDEDRSLGSVVRRALASAMRQAIEVRK